VTAERLRRLREVYDRVLAAPEAERAGLLDRLAAGDDSLRAEVEVLLATRSPSTGEWRAAAWMQAGFEWVPEDRSGSQIGPYRLERLLGRGGMGEVYLARREGHAEAPPVALKLIAGGPESAALGRRFQQEGRILSTLRHPGIAGLLDAGLADDGRPYLVMEYVEGEPLTTWCERTGQPIEGRIRMIQEVCRIVQFAHQNLVIHRDLKPANILVNADGEVKLLDFGIAKLLAPSADELETTTSGGRPLTPSYASPEQIRGAPVTTASDVFSLGVLAYELLTGRRPIQLGDLPLVEAMDRVITEEPAPPSTVVAGAEGPIGTRAWRRALEGDLDTILLMALRKEPERRYHSAAEFSADLQRHLEGRPVLARPDTVRYRVRKFVVRHRVGVLSTVGVLFVAAIGTAGTLSQSKEAAVERARALQRMADVRELASSLLFEVHDAVADLPGATEARRLILQHSFQNLEILAGEVRGNPELEWELAEAYLRTGIVQGDPTRASLGDLAGAEASFRRAVELAGRLVTTGTGDWRARRTLALSHEKLGDVRAWGGNVEEGIAHAREALAGYQAIAAAFPDSTRHQLSVAISLVKLGDLSGNMNFPNLGDAEAALRYYEAARQQLAAPPLSVAPAWGTRRYAALVDERIGTIHRNAGRLAQARDSYRRSLEAREELARDDPANLDAQRDLGVTRQNLCEAHLALGEGAPALTLCREAMAIYDRLYQTDPSNAQAVGDVAIGSHSLAGALRATGRLDEAFGVLEDGIARIREILTAAPANLPNRRTLGRLLARHTLYAREAGRPAPHAAEALAVLEALRAEGHPLGEQERLVAQLRAAAR
jgi:non-specific serine/threonine protein kinase/serine/threonine-protein kinase